MRPSSSSRPYPLWCTSASLAYTMIGPGSSTGSAMVTSTASRTVERILSSSAIDPSLAPGSGGAKNRARPCSVGRTTTSSGPSAPVAVERCACERDARR
ncbi:MAG: hypothetical protein AB7I24_12285, partial [Candidatus Nanopelagicales bacterium]